VKSLFTIGYEGRTVDELLARLMSNRVGLVVDVRALPLSHKRGFSKHALAKALEGVGIAYAHRAALGTPKSMRTRYKSNHDFGALKAAFDKYLRDQTDSLLELIDFVRRRRTCLLCFEADPAQCHRSLVAAAARRLGGPPAKHL
jgi:uncharacterized protein (DUF488 family)